jgi:hypothetical protein
MAACLLRPRLPDDAVPDVHHRRRCDDLHRLEERLADVGEGSLASAEDDRDDVEV